MSGPRMTRDQLEELDRLLAYARFAYEDDLFQAAAEALKDAAFLCESHAAQVSP